ncbi:hypothetical protein [Methanosarcina sp. WWM596]
MNPSEFCGKMHKFNVFDTRNVISKNLWDKNEFSIQTIGTNQF